MSPGARNSRIYALEDMLSTTSSTLVSMASQLSEAEERERAFNGSGRWNQIRSLPNVKTVLNFLFNIASSARCSLWDKEVNCREKDCEIRDLKEKVVHLIGQLEMQEAEFIHQEKLWKSAMKKESNSGKSIQSSDELHAYELRMKGSQKSILYNVGENFVELLEDMDTSESEHSSHEVDDDIDWEYSDIDWEYYGWRHAEAKRRRPKTNRKLSKPKRHSVALSNSSYSDDKETINVMPAVEQDTILKKISDVCCSCSKHSFCKTAKCECRVVGGNCGASCGCNPKKCSNREVSIKNLGALPPLELLEGTRNVSSTDEIERSNSLAFHGAMLLNTALSEIPTEIKNDIAAKRKPLSDIGNTKVK